MVFFDSACMHACMHHDCHDHALVPFWLSAVWLCMPEGRSWCCQTTRSKQQEPNHQMTLLTRLLFLVLFLCFSFSCGCWLAGCSQPASCSKQVQALWFVSAATRKKDLPVAHRTEEIKKKHSKKPSKHVQCQQATPMTLMHETLTIWMTTDSCASASTMLTCSLSDTECHDNYDTKLPPKNTITAKKEKTCKNTASKSPGKWKNVTFKPTPFKQTYTAFNHADKTTKNDHLPPQNLQKPLWRLWTWCHGMSHHHQWPTSPFLFFLAICAKTNTVTIIHGIKIFKAPIGHHKNTHPYEARSHIHPSMEWHHTACKPATQWW